MLPLQIVTDLVNGLIRRTRRAAQFDERHITNSGNVTFDEISLHLGHFESSSGCWAELDWQQCVEGTR